MKFALVDNKRQLPTPQTVGSCPACTSDVIAKCGHVKVWHWAHKAIRHCDRWWEPETEWHRGWKNRFPADWQEIVHIPNENEKHVADVKTADGLVVEFQHSAIKPEERVARETFYGRMVWVVSGLRRKNDSKQLDELIRRGLVCNAEPVEVWLGAGKGALLRDWLPSSVPVFFDFGRPELWLLKPNKNNGAIMAPVGAESFVDWCHGRNKLQGFKPQSACQLSGADGGQLISPLAVSTYIKATRRRSKPVAQSRSRSRWPIRRM